MEPINVRIKALIEELNVSNHAFAKAIGKSASAINFMVEGRSKPSFDVLEAICDTYPQINPGWLLKGEGEMKRSVVSTEAPVDKDYLGDYLQKLEEQFNRLLNQLETKDQQIQTKDRQIEKLMDLLGKLEGANENQLYTTKVMELYPVVQQHG